MCVKYECLRTCIKTRIKNYKKLICSLIFWIEIMNDGKVGSRSLLLLRIYINYTQGSITNLWIFCFH